MSWRSVQDIALFQIVWLSAAIGAARGLTWPGIAAAAIAIALHATATDGRTLLKKLAVCGLTGFLLESVLVSTGAVRYGAPWPSEVVAPLWIAALWLAFATTLSTTRRALGQRPIAVAAALGAIMGPLTYMAGERLGALTLAEPRLTSLGMIAFLWCAALPTILAPEAGAHGAAKN
jgi:Protein of unknown function (DUF2878)